MAENSLIAEEKTVPKTRGPAKRARRNYAVELADLQGRADMAVRLLRHVSDPLVTIAIETLEGD